jgi:hypothetical protein
MAAPAAAAEVDCPGAPSPEDSGWQEFRRQLALPLILPFVGPPIMELEAVKSRPWLTRLLCWGAPPRADNSASVAQAQQELTETTAKWQEKLSLDVKNLSQELRQLLQSAPGDFQAAMEEETQPLREWIVLLTIQAFFVVLVLGVTVFYYA